jgi:hypothetical protein
MAKRKKKERVLDLLEGLPGLSRLNLFGERQPKKEEREQFVSVKARILDILNSQPLISAGRVQMIGLETVKRRLGDQWEGHRDAIHSSLSTIMRRKLSASDVFFRHEEDDYVIVFATLGHDAAKLVCVSIMQELNALLLGDEDTRSITIRTAVGVVDGRLLLEEKGIGEVLAGLTAVDPDCMLEWDQDLELQDPESTSTTVSSTPLGWEPMTSRKADGRSKESQAWIPINEAALDEGVLPDQFELIYRPMWSPVHEITSTFTANYVGTDDEGVLRNAYSFVRSAKLIRALDVNVLQKAADVASTLFAENQRFVLAIPHHYESVTNWTRLYEYVDRWKAIPVDVQNYVILSCDDYPPGVPASKLLMIGHALKPLGRGLAATVAWSTRDLAPYVDAGFTALALFVPTDLPIAVIQARIEEFAETGRRRGFQTLVLNVHDIRLGEIVRQAGIDFVMGRLIGDYQKTPSHMTRTPWAEIKSRSGKVLGKAPIGEDC